MAKRFTDTAKWKKSFIKGLEAKYKLLWFYILDDCDHAGIWEVDFEVASLRIGEDVGYEDSFVALGEQIVPIGKSRWWIRDFISFQYGDLTQKNKMYKPVMDVLQKYNIQLSIPHISPIDGVKVKDRVKVKEEVKDNNLKEPDFSKPDIEGEEIVFPIDTPLMRDLWTGWKKYRYRAHLARYGFMGEQAELKRLQNMTFPQVEEAILKAISSNWKGIYPEKNGKATHNNISKKQQQSDNSREYLKDYYTKKASSNPSG